MADKIAALIGPGQGTWHFTGNLKEPRIQIRGLKEGEVIETEHRQDMNGNAFSVGPILNSNGEYPVTPARYSRVIHEGSSKTLLCSFMGG